MVSSTRSRTSASLGLRSVDTSTSTLMPFFSHLESLSSLVSTCCRNLSFTPVRRPLTMMSIGPPSSRGRRGRPSWLCFPLPPRDGKGCRALAPFRCRSGQVRSFHGSVEDAYTHVRHGHHAPHVALCAWLPRFGRGMNGPLTTGRAAQRYRACLERRCNGEHGTAAEAAVYDGPHGSACHPPRLPRLRPHIRLLRGSPLLFATTALLPAVRDIGTLRGAGLTSKAHRDRSTKSRLTWAVSPAPGLGLPELLVGVPASFVSGATTDPAGCHTWTVTRPATDVRYGLLTRTSGIPHNPLHARTFRFRKAPRKTFVQAGPHPVGGSR